MVLQSVTRVLIVLLFVVLATASSMIGVSTASAELQINRVLELCPHDNPVQQVPASLKVGNSRDYPDGARTCSWRGQREVNYSCTGGSATPRIAIVSSENGARRVLSAPCDGRQRTIYTSQYPTSSGTFHVHFYREKGWTAAYIRVN